MCYCQYFFYASCVQLAFSKVALAAEWRQQYFRHFKAFGNGWRMAMLPLQDSCFTKLYHYIHKWIFMASSVDNLDSDMRK